MANWKRVGNDNWELVTNTGIVLASVVAYTNGLSDYYIYGFHSLGGFIDGGDEYHGKDEENIFMAVKKVECKLGIRE